MSSPFRMPFHLALWLAITLQTLGGCRAQSTPLVVSFVATDYTFQMPDTIAAGWTTFRLVNNGGQPHMAQLIRLDSGMTLATYLEAYGEAFRARGTRPEGARRLGGPTVTAPRRTNDATLHLEPGSYAWICLYNIPDGIPHVVGHGMAEPFVVETAAAVESQAAPTADVVMRLVDYAFTMSTPLTAGRHTIRAVNDGSDSHEVSVAKLTPGKTIQDVKAWIQNPADAPPLNIEDVAGVTSLAPDAEAYFEVDLTPGEYVLLCFVTAPDGRSHIDHGMIQQVTVR